MAEKKASPDLVKLAFELVAEHGWRRFSLAELARRANVPLAKVYAELPDRPALLRALGRRLDAHMLDVTPSDLAALSPRERVFEMIMRRLEGMAPYKAGLRVLGREARGEADLLVTSLCNLGRLSRWLLDAADVQAGAGAPLAATVLSAIYVRVFGIWLDDDTPDLARTMAELDRRLQQAETLARWTRRGRSQEPPQAEAAPAA